MKKNILFIMLLFTLALFGGTSNNNQKSNDTPIEEESNLPSIDTSQPLMQQLQKAFSSLKPNSNFYGLKIKEISHPSKFVGTWTMWSDLRGDKSTINQDGTCSNEFFYFKRGKTKKVDCLQWYHVTFNDNESALLFIYPKIFSLVSYEWNDKNNIYFHYYNGGGHLATRANSSFLAKNIKERFLLGTWQEKTSNLKVFWTFAANHKFLIKTYTIKDNKLVFNQEGTWKINKRKITITVEGDQNSHNTFERRSLPPKEIVLNFLYGIERLGFRKFNRYSEPLMISTDPYLGKFQAHSTYNSYNAISLNISKKSNNNYLVDIFWNSSHFPQNSAKKIDGLLHVATEFGTIIFKPVINGIQKINILNNKSFNFPERILRISQDPSKKDISIVGRWVESVHYSLPEKYRYFTFLDNGHFFHKNGDYNAKIGRKGIYRKIDDTLYLKPLCGKEEKVESITLNEAHFAPASYKGQSFVKIKNSKALSSLWYALRAYEIDYKKQLTKLTAHPKYKSKFLFSKEIVYDNIGFLSMHFKPNGEMFTYYSGQFQTIHQDYYIEINQGVEKIVLLKSSNHIDTVSNPKFLKLYDARQTICSKDTWELGKQK